MKNILGGFILIFLDFNLNLGNSKIDLLPDFLGYIIIIKGLVDMSGESTMFTKIKPYVTVMAVYTAFLFLLDLGGVSVSLGILSYVLGFITTAFSLYISYNIVMGIIDIEENKNANLDGNSLKYTWKYLAVFSILSFVSIFIPVVAIVCVIISFIVSICFLVAFNKSKNLYYDIVDKNFE